VDLRVDFHRILLKQGEEFKTTFETHIDHCEFRVVTFGLTGAAITLQKAMNTTLDPLLRNVCLFSLMTYLSIALHCLTVYNT
jgi:hypothetical protein